MNAPENATPNPPLVRSDSHLTLHYRISLAINGADVISTFGDRPATLTLGLGQMAQPLEQRLLGLSEGQSAAFDLAADEGFGPRNPDLLQRVSRSTLETNGAPDTTYHPGEVLDFAAPDGGRFAGIVKEVDEAGALVDFNHPLAGQPLRFEVNILGVL